MSDVSKSIGVLEVIIEDCKTDVENFEGKEFNGKTIGEMHGVLEAKIQVLAKIMKKHLEEK